MSVTVLSANGSIYFEWPSRSSDEFRDIAAPVATSVYGMLKEKIGKGISSDAWLMINEGMMIICSQYN